MNPAPYAQRTADRPAEVELAGGGCGLFNVDSTGAGYPQHTHIEIALQRSPVPIGTFALPFVRLFKYQTRQCVL